MSLTLTELATRVAREISGARQVWLDDHLDPAFHAALPPWVRVVSEPDQATVAVVVAEQVSVEGTVTTARDELVVEGPVLAVLPDADTTGEPIVRRLSRPAVARATRVFTRLGVLEVISEGLLVVELAPGVAATELQRIALPTLLIPPAVTEMDLTPPTSELDRAGDAS